MEKEDPQVEEGQGDEEIKITVRHGKKRSRCFTLCTSGSVWDLQQEIHSWCNLPPAEQRLFHNGIRLPPELSLSDLWDGISVTLGKGMQGGAGCLSWGGKKKRGRKKSAQRAAARRKAVAAEMRFYDETKRMIEARNRPHEEFNYGEFEEYMATEADKEDFEEAAKKEEEYRQEIAKYEVPLYGTLSPTKKADDSIRFMSINVNCLSMWKRFNYKAKRLQWLLKNYQVNSMELQEVCVN